MGGQDVAGPRAPGKRGHSLWSLEFGVRDLQLAFVPWWGSFRLSSEQCLAASEADGPDPALGTVGSGCCRLIY